MRLLRTLCLTVPGLFLGMLGAQVFARGPFMHLPTPGHGRAAHIVRRSQVTQDMLNDVFAKMDADAGLRWIFKRRKFEEFGKRKKLQEIPAEWYEALLKEVETGSIEQVELAGPDLVNEVKKTIKGNHAKSQTWLSLMTVENGGIGSHDPKKLQREFVQQALAKLRE